MTKQELNRDIKRLYKKYSNRESWDKEQYWDIESQCKSELHRLWFADREKAYTNYNCFKMLIVMNQSWRVITLHQLATFLEI